VLVLALFEIALVVVVGAAIVHSRSKRRPAKEAAVQASR
jgi:hypothetical protein